MRKKRKRTATPSMRRERADPHDVQGRNVKNKIAASAARIVKRESKKEGNAWLREQKLEPMELRKLIVGKKLMPAYRTIVHAAEFDRFDVTPMEYADFVGISERSARMLFSDWVLMDHHFVRRRGRPTTAFPEGKLLRMSRKYFERVVKG